LALALNPPPESLQLPFTAGEKAPAMCFVSCFCVPGGACRARFHDREADGNPLFRARGMVANLDFVESIFGNAGDPYLPENDASLDPMAGPATPVA
jgi:hypothetical protein